MWCISTCTCRYIFHFTNVNSHAFNLYRFGTVAYLQQTWWLEVEGSFEFEFPVGTYSVFFRLHLGRPSVNGRRNPDKIHGWDVKPVTFQLETSNSGHAKSEGFLNQQGKWLYHHVGDFVVENSNVPTWLKFSMTQIDCTHTKGGVCVDSVFVFPRRRWDQLEKRSNKGFLSGILLDVEWRGFLDF